MVHIETVYNRGVDILYKKQKSTKNNFVQQNHLFFYKLKYNKEYVGIKVI